MIQTVAISCYLLEEAQTQAHVDGEQLEGASGQHTHHVSNLERSLH